MMRLVFVMLPTMIIALVVLGFFVVMLVGQESDMRIIGAIVSVLLMFSTRMLYEVWLSTGNIRTPKLE
ncbi:hypothetical protein JQ760_028575 (plasmid) [Klebsiella pneumoniae]|uniref:hypothetical protein n=1 Tax=Klebsiella pneumoniae TaxID=573 RepID=UPI001FAC3066|nr:hypothetical protein [Klebsiella pneumoniae]MCI8109343.1 hypothetical protein [Klebsiella pneumoniae]